MIERKLTIPFRLCCGQQHWGPQCPDGLVMCCMCFDRFPLGELYLDPVDGKMVDVCQDCHDKDEAAFRVKRRSG